MTDNPALQCFCVNGKMACPHPDELACAYYHIEFGLKQAREAQTKELKERKKDGR